MISALGSEGPHVGFTRSVQSGAARRLVALCSTRRVHDDSRGATREVRRRAKLARVTIDFTEGDVESLPYESSAFDVVQEAPVTR